MKQNNHHRIDVLKIDISGEFELLYTLWRTGFDFKARVGLLLLEVHAFHPQEDFSLVNCCYGGRDMNWVSLHLHHCLS